ncbi:MAG TPA: DUF4398 domain-containing protein [Exilispira sp.]|nr:DUF4398 domain-containing protein [Exilispira sp.]
MKNKFFLFIILVFCIFLLAAAGCKTTEPTQQQTTQQTEETQQQTTQQTEETQQQTQETQPTEETKAETESQTQTAPVFDEEEASKLMDELKLDIAKAQQMDAEEYSPELFRQAMDLFTQAEEIYNQKQDYETFKQLIEKARATAQLAYNDAAEKKYQESKEQLLILKQQTANLSFYDYYKDDFSNVELLLQQAEELKEKQDYVGAINKIEQAKQILKKIENDFSMDQNYVYSEFPKVLDLQKQLIDKNIKLIYADDYEKFNQYFVELKDKIDKQDYKAAKELLQISYIFGRNLIERYNQAIAIINQTEASRYLFHAKEAYEIAKLKESSFNDEQKNLLSEMEMLINKAEQSLKNQIFIETINYCKDAMKIYLKLTFNEDNKVKTYTVRLIPERRDCLWRIAGYPFIYNNPFLWPLIWIANLDIITNPDLIFPGQILIIPPLPQ